MSIIEKTNPLNLQFCVCVILNASNPLGIIISKTLLKANALVLGIDSRPKHESLNAGLGTHFQYEQTSPGDVSSEQVMSMVQERYGTERIDVVVNVVEHGQAERMKDVVRLTEGLAGIIAGGARGKGALLTVMSDLEDTNSPELKKATDVSRDLALKFGEQGVRYNFILGAATIGADTKAYDRAKEHMHALMRTEKIAKDVSEGDASKQPASKLYDVGNVTLFLAGDMGEDIASAIVARDGSYRNM